MSGNGQEPRWQLVEVGDARVEVRVSTEPPHRGRRLWPSVGEYPVYDEFFYQVMLQDEERNKLFRDAIIGQAEGRVVLELGAGPDLLWSSLAARSGATQVVAVEVLEDSARAASERAREIGPRMLVVHGEATQVALGERADMCIAELVGAIGGAEGIGAVIDDARDRHLRPAAVVVPHRVKTPIAALGAGELLGRLPALHPSAACYVGEVLRSVDSIFDLRICVSGLNKADLLTTTSLLEDLNLTTGSYQFPQQIQLAVTRPGGIDSFVCWLGLQCAPGQQYLDSMEAETNWAPVLVPLDVDRPVPVEAGDTIELSVIRRLHDGIYPEWSFTGEVRHGDGSATPVRAECSYAHGPFRASWLHRALFRDPARGRP